MKEHLILISWNVNGWTENNKLLRQEILYSFKADLICLSETHLSFNKNIDLIGYKWYGHNRDLKHSKSPKTFGGVGIFVKNYLFDLFDISIVDNSFDGIIGLKLKHKKTDYEIVVYSLYLPPENSIWCNQTDFFGHLICQLYFNTDADAIYLCGDLNSRTGNLDDVIREIDSDIKPRVCIDNVVNKQGKLFIDFMKDTKLCMLNGRINVENNNYSSVTVKGRSLVDYIVTPHVCLDTCEKFDMISVTEIMDYSSW